MPLSGCAAGEQLERAALVDEVRSRDGTAAVVRGRVQDLWASLIYGASSTGFAVVSLEREAEGDDMIARMLGADDREARVFISGVPELEELDPRRSEEMFDMVLRAEVGRLGDALKEEEILARVIERLESLASEGPSRVDWTEVVGSQPLELQRKNRIER